MSTQDTDERYAPTSEERPTSDEPAEEARGDNRNEELDESPVPDPTQRDTDADDDPEAD